MASKPVSPLRRPFVIAGALVGVVLSVWYLADNFGRASVVPDPIWARFVNVALLLFLSIYLFNLLRHLVELVTGRKRRR